MNLTYIQKLKSTGDGYTTRLSYATDYTQAELDALVAAAHNVTPAQAQAIGREYFLTLMASAQPRRILDLFGLLSVRPTSGGATTLPDGFHTPQDIRGDITVTFQRDTIRDWLETCTIQKVGEEGLAAPQLDSVINELSGAFDRYTAGQNIRILGDDLAFDKSTLTQGVFYQPAAGGAWVRVGTYGPVTNKNIYALIPTGVTGAQRLRVINSRDHETVYTTLLQP